jgi:hypothetical protein
MTHRPWTRRASAALLLVAILSMIPLTAAEAVRDVQETPDARVGQEAADAQPVVTTRRICPVRWRLGPDRVRRLIRCAAVHFGVDVRIALAVADRESHFRPRAFNSWSCAKGIYQHLCRYWAGRARAYGYRGWSAFNARANIMVTMRMVRRLGWSPWGV